MENEVFRLAMPRIVVVEDHPNLRRSITQMLVEAGFEAVAAGSLSDAGNACAIATDLIILDLMLPDGNGLEWLKDLRQAGRSVLVLVLTAKDAVRDRVAGLDAGADDYLVKPFSMSELMARVRALLRRDERAAGMLLEVNGLRLSLLDRVAWRGAVELSLTTRQFELLACLMRQANQIVSREMIAESVWKDLSATWTNVIEVHINQLRKKLDVPGTAPLLHTIRGKGYLLGDSP
ncbi:MAG: response regulator transcription factor [Planctomycetaceae bacterium]